VTTDRSEWLRIERDRGGGAQIAAGDVLHVGRSPDAGLVVEDDPHISAMHFRVSYRDGTWLLEDLGSRNGTSVNGTPVREVIIRDDDRIVAGESVFQVRIATAASEGTTVQSADAPVAAGIINRTPFAVGTAYSEDANRQAWLSIVVKATWTIDDKPALAEKQWPVFVSDRLAADDPLSPVRFESDLAPFKPLADVVLVGRAYAPGGKAVTQLLAGIRIGDLRFVAAVFGDRTWEWHSNGPPVVSRPQPFTEMDLVYERSFGGVDVLGAGYFPYNLSGTGFIAQPARESVEGVRVPNLEDPQNLITSWDSRPKPMAFGFYGRGWTPRLRYAGSYDPDAPAPQSWPPPDFSERFYNGAHPDLQVDGYLAGDEEVALVKVCPDRPDVRFRLPGRVPRIQVGSCTASRGSVLDTLVFVPDDGVFYEVFRTRLKVPSLDSPQVDTIVIDGS
jgi:hypothetical protein